MSTKPLLQKILQRTLHTESEITQNQDGKSQTTEEKTRNQRITLIQLHTIKSLNN
jgi:hypothetical protein